MKRFTVALGTCAALIVGSGPARSQGQGLAGGRSLELGPCIGATEHDASMAAVEAFRRNFGPLPPQNLGGPSKFTFYPMAGKLYRDLYTFNFNDLDPSGGILDWDCTNFTYNGHDATDVLIRTFGEQAIGVPIFAALDGVVVSTHDGEPDMNTSCTGVGNHVIVLHGNGRLNHYWHFKKDSILVGVGDDVKAGQQLGLTGSSGCSTYPHLHFATYDNGAMTEPYAGPCRPGESDWVDQTPIERDLYLGDLNITDVDISNYPGLPFDMPRTGTFVQGLRTARFWAILVNLPAGSTWRVRFVRPNGSTALDSGNVNFNNPYYRWSWWWWGYPIDFDQIGTWQVQFYITGQLLTQAPLEVVASQGEVVNRAPNDVTAEIVPSLPTTDDVLICEVDNDLVLDDRDYDIVRYRYEWSIGANVLRDVTTAALSDVLPRLTAPPGSVVTCAVTPSDGLDDASTVRTSASVRGASPYCTAKTNSCGTSPAISFTGEASATASTGFTVTATSTKAERAGLLLYTDAGRAALLFHGGLLCLNPVPLKRSVTVLDTSGTPGQCDGVLAIDMNAFAHGNLGGNPLPALLVSGTQVNCQFWARDTIANGSLLSDALEFVVGP